MPHPVYKIHIRDLSRMFFKLAFWISVEIFIENFWVTNIISHIYGYLRFIAHSVAGDSCKQIGVEKIYFHVLLLKVLIAV
jgi:hypothetical protein